MKVKSIGFLIIFGMCPQKSVKVYPDVICLKKLEVWRNQPTCKEEWGEENRIGNIYRKSRS